MSAPAAALLITAMVLLWDAALLFGCAYLVFWRGESGWWFVLACVLMYSGTVGAGQAAKKPDAPR